jgi:3-phosphoglycerate kinase
MNKTKQIFLIENCRISPHTSKIESKIIKTCFKELPPDKTSMEVAVVEAFNSIHEG